MLSFIIIVLVLSSLFRRPRYWGFPFMGGWGYRRPPMGWHHRPRWVGLMAWVARTAWVADSGVARMVASDFPSDLRAGENQPVFSANKFLN